jgi:hypothetical protein
MIDGIEASLIILKINPWGEETNGLLLPLDYALNISSELTSKIKLRRFIKRNKPRYLDELSNLREF